MRTALFVALALGLAGCDACAPGSPDAGPAALEAPGALPRPPTGGLPAELRPPR